MSSDLSHPRPAKPVCSGADSSLLWRISYQSGPYSQDDHSDAFIMMSQTEFSHPAKSVITIITVK